MSEINNKGQLIGDSYVAKDTKYINKTPKSAKKSEHILFYETQRHASKYAKKFNTKLDQLNISKQIPRIEFLQCSIYASNDFEIEFLVEKRLNPSNYIKYNDNAGGLDGIGIINKKPAEIIEIIQRNDINKQLEVLNECEEEDESDIGSTDQVDNQDDNHNNGKSHHPLEDSILDIDIPQAFSHWTFTYTKRESLVCDLQGELCLVNGSPVFEFTDPCIHCVKNNKYGRTNHGHKGINSFFKTHHCNSVCKLVLR